MIERWALVSGLRGDLETYDLIQRDLKKTRGVTSLFVLGDLVGPERNSDALLDRLKNPHRGDLKPDCIYGWWEEQLLAERGFVVNAKLMRCGSAKEKMKSPHC